MQSPATPALNTAFHCENPRWQRRYEQALEGLAANVRLLPCYPRPVLQEGGMYQGIWLECGPHEGALYGEYDPQIARNNHEIFWDLAREDGFIPPFIRETPGDGQLQTVVPLAQTALECAQKLGQESLLARGYEACARYDAWLGQYRDNRGTGLVELHCEWDSGHDNSPRHAGLKQHCPGYDARQRDSLPELPLLAPDLSATKYLGRVALAQMARLLGRAGEEAMWLERAEALRQQILRLTFDADTGFFYDVDAQGRFVRVKGDAGLRVLMCRVPDEALFAQILSAHVLNPAEFWTPYPLASIAADEPGFNPGSAENSWGGASQALEALRAPLWLEFYQRFDVLEEIMRRWLEALMACDAFRQQMNPFNGAFNTTERYSPSMLVLTDFIARRHGVKYAENGILWGTASVPQSAAHSFETRIGGHRYRLEHQNGASRLWVDGRLAAVAQGAGRVLTDWQGRVREIYPTGAGRLVCQAAEEIAAAACQKSLFDTLVDGRASSPATAILNSQWSSRIFAPCRL